MRTAEQDIVNAVRDGRNFRGGHCNGRDYNGQFLSGYRDDLSWNGSDFTYLLWNNKIAFGNAGDKTITVNDCGYPTATTVSRLNAIFAGLDIPITARIEDKTTRYTIADEDGINEVIPGNTGITAEVSTNGWTVTIR